MTPWTTACQTLLPSSISQYLLKFMSIELVVLSNHLILCQPLLLLPSVFPSTRVISNEEYTIPQLVELMGTELWMLRVDYRT